ncbi:MAG TPA: cobalamin B12-binding domain-containing protein [Ktedonobacterales bacterium]|nr:cobalamin B12-binding domain-containing protein [Ktedonobacterales bacterium]
MMTDGTHPTVAGGGGGGGGDRPGGSPPNLATFSGEPKYDLPTIVQLVGVRSMVLVGWEQQFGIPAPSRLRDDGRGAPRRYSERDLIAVLWIRDQILRGSTPGDAAALLLRHQPAGLVAPVGARVPPVTRPLNPQDFASMPSMVPPGRGSSRTGSLGSGTSFASGVSHAWGPSSQVGSTQPLSQRHGQISTSSQGSSAGWEPAAATRGHHTWLGQTGGPATTAAAASAPRARDPRALVGDLVRAFINLDTVAADRTLREALAGRGIENVTVNLLQPALQRTGEMWAQHLASTTEGAFAENYVRGVLFQAFRETPEQPNGSLVIVGCAPRELSEIDALTLAVAWRGAGMRVIYLGQDVNADGLIKTVRQRHPAMISLAISTSQRIRTLARLARALAQIDGPKPYFGFYGPIFARHPELQQRIGGVYLGDDVATATFHLGQLLGLSRSLG